MRAELRVCAQIVSSCLAMPADADVEAWQALGLGEGGHLHNYGLSKALLNAYIMFLAESRPKLMVNSCTPGERATLVCSELCA